MDLKALSDERLRALIDNFERLGCTADHRYAAAVEEQNRRDGAGLDFNRSLDLLLKAAREGRFVSYKEIADAHGATWNKVRFAMTLHVYNLNKWAVQRGAPMIGSIVVDKKNLATGEKEPTGLRGFAEGARLLGFDVHDPERFHREQQAATFVWAKAPGSVPIEP